MSGHRLTVALFGRTIVDVTLGPAAATDTSESESKQPGGEAPGPVTDRRAAPALGFAPAARDLHKRPVIK